jgi:ATP-dependent protease ClpP protease subunit
MRTLLIFLGLTFLSTAYADPQDIKLTADNSIVLRSPVFEPQTSFVVKAAKDMDAKLPSGYPIYLVLDTPGGSIEDGLRMIGALQHLNRPVHTVTVFAASMGFQTVQGLGQRYILDKGTLMAHRARGFFFGEFPGTLDTRFAYYSKRVEQMDLQDVKRTNGKQTLESFRRLIQNEYWCDGADCVASGFADAVVNASCDASLAGTVEELEKFMFFGARVEITYKYAACPLVSGVLDFDIHINGQNAFRTPEDRKTGTSSWDRLSSDLKPEQLDAIFKQVQVRVKERTDRTNVRAY